MLAQLPVKRILIDGSIMTTFVASIAMLMLYINPHIALSDYVMLLIVSLS